MAKRYTLSFSKFWRIYCDIVWLGGYTTHTVDNDGLYNMAIDWVNRPLKLYSSSPITLTEIERGLQFLVAQSVGSCDPIDTSFEEFYRDPINWITTGSSSWLSRKDIKDDYNTKSKTIASFELDATEIAQKIKNEPSTAKIFQKKGRRTE